jgi:hypothetical protein
MSRIYDEWVPVIPSRGTVKDVARALLAIAGDARLVRTEGNGAEFLVPSWVADKFTTPAEPDKKPAPRKRASRARTSEDQT